jgi:multisubunit Na+/H+ antiporter MnhG subunit
VKTASINVLVLGAAVLSLLSAWLMLRMKDEYQMMHFMAPPASVSAGLIVIAIFLQQGFKQESFKALFIGAVLTLMNAVVTHATARAFRIREAHGWRASPGQEVPERSTDERISAGPDDK